MSFESIEQHDGALDEESMSVPVRICAQCHTGPMVKRFIGRAAVVMREYITRDSDPIVGKVILHDTCVVDYLTERTSTFLQAIS